MPAMRICGSTVRLFAFCALAFAHVSAQAQFLPAKPDSVASAVLGQKRAIEVFLPQESAKDPAQRYETIYVLDGDWNAQLVVNTVAFLRQVGRMPTVIVVSVPNFFDERGANSRDVNFLPILVDGKPKPASAPDFLAFLKTELVPYVDRHYPANGTNLLHGHSYGGIFAFYALVREPALFDGYLIVDPALHWNHHALDGTIEDGLPGLPTKGKTVYIAARSGRAYEGMGISTIEPVFKNKAPAGLHWSLKAYADETHDSVKLKGTYDALKYAYQGYAADQVELVPTAGIVLKGKPVYLFADGDRHDLRYTLDGSVPDESSPVLEGPIAVSDPQKTKVKLVSNRGVFDRDVPHGLKFGKALAPTTAVRREKSDAWSYLYYPAEAWPNLRRAKPFAAGEAEQALDFSAAGRDSFAGSVERSFEVSAEGYYVFAVVSPEKVRLSVSGVQVIDNDGAHGHRQQAFVAPLRAGTYSLRAEFLHAVKTTDVHLFVFRCKDGDAEWWKNELFHLNGEAKR